MKRAPIGPIIKDDVVPTPSPIHTNWEPDEAPALGMR